MPGQPNNGGYASKRPAVAGYDKATQLTNQRKVETGAGRKRTSGPASASAVTPELVADQVYEALRTAIVTGELTGGSPLRVRDLAEMVGTSVMPVREAIRRLEDIGLARRKGVHRGMIVREYTVAELVQIYQVRAILEVEAAARGTARAADSDIAAMEAASARMEYALAERRACDALDDNESFLRTLYTAAGNTFLLENIEALWLKCRPYTTLAAREAIECGESAFWTPRLAILEAARVRDVKVVSGLTQQSLASAKVRLERSLEAC